MPAFKESDRVKKFGVYTGCPCPIELEKGVSTTDKELSNESFNKLVNDLISEWHKACDKFVPGPVTAPRITQNWNKQIKLPYGKFAHITCIYDQQGSVNGRYCKFSLKEKRKDAEALNFEGIDIEKCKITGKKHRWNKNYFCEDCGLEASY